MADVVEHLLLCLSEALIPPLVEVALRPSGHFLAGLFVFLPFTLERFSLILGEESFVRYIIFLPHVPPHISF